MEPQRLLPGDSTLVENIVNYLKAKGIFDEFRHECLADVDTKSSCQNLSQRVDGYASKFLGNETWHPDLNKNELRNKLRRHIDESGMLAVGADHVVEQVINPKIHQLFLPKIIEVVHQYMKEQNEMLNKKPETSSSDNTLSENTSDTSDSNKAKTSISDPIADILSFSYSKTKATPTSSTHGKTDNILQKYTSDVSKVEKKKEEKNNPVVEKNVLESPNENPTTPVVIETKAQNDKEKEKIKKDELDTSVEVPKKILKEEIKPEKKKVEETKLQSSEVSATMEESKSSTSFPVKPNISSKKDVDKSKQKSKSANTHKTFSNPSEIKKPKKESMDKTSEKHVKSKPKPPKESSSPTKNVSSGKSVAKDEKGGDISKSKSSDSSSSKTSESSLKKSSKSGSSKKDHGNSKHKSHGEKSEKYKISKSADKTEQSIHESAGDEKGRNIHYSSSYDSSQGSDQEKSSSSSSRKERQKHFSKHAKKESSEKHSDKSSKTSSYKRRSKDTDESLSKKHKSEKSVAHEKFKETITVGEAAKISSRSNSFGSTSSVSSSSNTSKDNTVSNSDEALESSGKDKKKKQVKEKESCHDSKTLPPPPPPPPPPSSSLSFEFTSSAEMSSIEEDTQSSSDSENSSSEELSEQSSSDLELESKESVLNTLNESVLNPPTDDINDFYDIFLYSSSSSEFEGYGNSPEKTRIEHVLKKIKESDVSVSSVHTSDLSSYDDELSDEDCFFNDESQPSIKKRLSLKEAQELIQRKAFLRAFNKKKNTPIENKSDDNDVSFNKRCVQRSSSHLSSEDESSPSEPKRSLRRERKLNPRYASSEYTSIFNSRKETFITKQSSQYSKKQTSNSSPIAEIKYKKESVVEKDKSAKKSPLETKISAVYQGNLDQSSKKRKICTSETLEEEKELSDSSEMSNSDEMDSIMDNEKSFYENDKSDNVSSADQLKLHLKIKAQNNSNYKMNSHPVKRKLIDAESSPAKRPCSRGSVDSSSFECVPNENKPFNNEKRDLPGEKLIRESGFKGSDLADAVKKDLFCKQRTSNNGDVLGQKELFPKNSYGKTMSTPEKKTSETENSKELSAL